MASQSELLASSQFPQALAEILTLAEQAFKTWEVMTTDFLDPRLRLEAEAALGQLTDLHGLAWGGYPQAERQRLLLARTDLPLSETQVDLELWELAGNFLFDPPTDGDFQQALLQSGIPATAMGDIIVLGDRGAQVILKPGLDTALNHVIQVRTVPVTPRLRAWSELKVRPPQEKTMSTVEASLRLDALASAGFGLSRNKMVELIQAGAVRINWHPVTQASQSLKSGDVVILKQRGQLRIGDIQLTKKERYRVNLTRIT